VDSMYLMVLPDLYAVLYFVTHPYPRRNARRRKGWTEEAGAGPGNLGLGLRDSWRWVYRGAEFSASRPDSGERSNPGA
jgi:FMN phosphatase YigB (HAD superfamily)